MKNIKYQPLVSIIMNCHDGENYLNESLKSVQFQTYKNWELIFFDNKSQDNSIKILKKFKDKRIKYYRSNKFLKLYDARNLAIKKSKGKYICFLDTDDLWKKNKIKTQVKFMEVNKNFAMVYSKYLILESKNKFRYFQNNYDLPSGNILEKILKTYTIGILTVCIRKKFFENKMFKKKYDIIGDFDFFVNLSKHNKIGCIQEPLAYYRIHENNLSKKKIKNFIEELDQWINKNEKKFKLKNISLFHQKMNVMKLKFKYFLSFLGM